TRASWPRRSPRRKRGVPSGSGRPDGSEKRELRDSAEMFETALAENPEDLTVLEALREIYTRLGDIERLMETAERIGRLDPDQPAGGGRRGGGAQSPTTAALPRTAPSAPRTASAPRAPAPPSEVPAAPEATITPAAPPPPRTVPAAPTIAT